MSWGYARNNSNENEQQIAEKEEGEVKREIERGR
jgi:hypothetical protein